MIRGFWKFYIIWELIAFIIVFGFEACLASSEIPTDNECYSCHEDDIKDDFDKLSVHLPFLQKKCHECHISDDPLGTSSGAEESNSTFTESTRIKWIGTSPNPHKTHWIPLRAEEVADKLYIKAQDDNQVLFMEKMDLPPDDSLKKIDEEKEPPRITDVKVPQVKRELFISAKIVWKTDEIATSKILYGIKSLDKISATDTNLVTNHQVELVGLKAKKTYKFKIVSEDMLGNKSESKIFTFSTAKSYQAQGEKREKQKPKRGRIVLNGEFFLRGGNYFAKFTADRPVSISVGVKPSAALGKKRSRSAKNDQVGTDHYWLKNDVDLNINNCYRCHSSVKEGASHPVNVYPKSGMTIPPEYATLSDGRISCMSCHGTHGSNYDYMLIKPTSRALCTGCHTELNY